jgi:hypothetical protein
VQSNLVPLDQLGKVTSASPEQQLRSALMNMLFGGDVDSLIEAKMKSMMGHNNGPPLDRDDAA